MTARMTHLALLTLLAIALTATMSHAGLFDPTAPSSASGPAAGVFDADDFQLNATRITPGKRMVIINGVSVGEGGRIGRARIQAITHGQVQLDVEGEPRTLRIAPDEVKKAR